MSLKLDALRKARQIVGGKRPVKAPAFLKSFGFEEQTKSKSKARKILLTYVVPVVVLGSIIAGGVVYWINRAAQSPMQAQLSERGLDPDSIPVFDEGQLLASEDQTAVDAETGEAVEEIVSDTATAVTQVSPPERQQEAARPSSVPPPAVDAETPPPTEPADLSLGPGVEAGENPQPEPPVDDGEAGVAETEAGTDQPEETAAEAPTEAATRPAAEADAIPEPEPPSPPVVTRSANDPFELALFFQRSGEYLRALDYYEEVLEANPMNAEVLNNIGVIHMQTSNNGQAMRSFRSAVLANPNYDQPHNNMGYVLMNEGRDEEAAREFRRALQINPRNADAIVNLALLARQSGDLEDAKIQLLQALQIDPAKAEAHYNLAFIYDSQGETGQAIKHFDLFLESGSDTYPDLVDQVEARIRELSDADQ